jgi:phosphate transport system ATP-binding protein
MNTATATVAPVTSPQLADDSVLKDKISIRNLDFYYGQAKALKNISLPLYANKATAFIGPSGCGKSTLLRVLNRMYDLYPGQRAGWISICCGRASEWCSKSRHRFR